MNRKHNSHKHSRQTNLCTTCIYFVYEKSASRWPLLSSVRTCQRNIFNVLSMPMNYTHTFPTNLFHASDYTSCTHCRKPVPKHMGVFPHSASSKETMVNSKMQILYSIPIHTITVKVTCVQVGKLLKQVINFGEVSHTAFKNLNPFNK